MLYRSDSKISGYIAAKILMNRYQEGQEIVLFLNNQKNSPAEVQMQRRLEGFMQYFAAEHKDLIIHDVVLHKENTASNEELLDTFLPSTPRLHWEPYSTPAYIKWQTICRKRDTGWTHW